MRMFLPLFFLYIALGESCLNSFSMKTSTISCQINFLPYGSSCASSDFNYCTIKYCSSASSTSNCSNFNSFNEFSFSSCINYCCGDSLTTDSPYSTVANCASDSKKQKTDSYASVDIRKVLMLIISIFGATAIFIRIAYCLYRELYKSDRIRAVDDRDINPEAPKLNIKKLSSDQLSVHNLMDREWKDISISLNEHPNCPICLGESPHLKVRCGYYFHPSCLRSWLKKKYQCGVCRGNRLSVFQLVCNVCFRKSTELTLEQLVKFKLDSDKIVCSECPSS